MHDLAVLRIDRCVAKDLPNRIDHRVFEIDARDDSPIRRLDEAVLVDLAVGRERADQTDVRTFRRLDRADAAVVRRVNVADVESGAIAAQTARTQGREPALVRQLSQRVGLVHELRQLTATEELAHRRHHWPGRADQTLRRDRLRILDRHALADTALEALEPGADVHLDQLADRADAAVAEMIDIVAARPLTIVEPDHLADDLDQVFDSSESGVVISIFGALLVAMQALVQLVAADARQVVPAVVEEQVLQHRGGVVLRRRIARAQPAIELDQRLVVGSCVGSFSIVVRMIAPIRRSVSTSAKQSRSSSSVSMPMARSRIVTGILRLRSTLTEMTSRFDVSNSSQAPRFGISLAVETILPVVGSGEPLEIDARRPHELRHNDALGAIDNEGAVRRHHREIAEEDAVRRRSP